MSQTGFRNSALSRHPLSVYERNKEAALRNRNPFALLLEKNNKNKSESREKSKSGMALKIKQQELDRIMQANNYKPTQPTFTYPLIELTTWGSADRSPPVLFENEEDEMQVGPEMRQVYNYLERVYQENKHRAIYEEYDYDDEDNHSLSGDDSDFE
jgi:hypothetical protein